MPLFPRWRQNRERCVRFEFIDISSYFTHPGQNMFNRCFFWHFQMIVAILWFPNDVQMVHSFQFFPYPVIDDERPWEHQCNAMPRGNCSGHYITSIAALLQLHQSAKTIRALSTSVIIEEAYKKNKNSTPTFLVLAKKCGLTRERVEMW